MRIKKSTLRVSFVLVGLLCLSILPACPSCSEDAFTDVFLGELDTSFGSNGTGLVEIGPDDGMGENGSYLAFDSRHNIIVAGSNPWISEDSPSTDKIWKFDEDGTVISTFGTGGELELGNSPVGVTGLVLDPSDNIYVAVSYRDNSAGEIVKYDENGTLLLAAPTDEVEGETACILKGLAIDADGSVYATCRAFAAEGEGEPTDQYLAIFKLDSAGTLSRFARFASLDEGDFQSLDILIDNNLFYVLGVLYDPGDPVPTQDVYIWRLTADGSLDTTFGTNGRADYGTGGVLSNLGSLAVDSSGTIFAVGFIGNADEGEDTTIGIWKYNTSTKGLDLFFPSSEIIGNAYTVASDDEDNLFLTGALAGDQGPYSGDATIWALDTSGAPITDFFTDGVYTDSTHSLSLMDASRFDYLGRLVTVATFFDTEEAIAQGKTIYRFK